VLRNLDWSWIGLLCLRQNIADTYADQKHGDEADYYGAVQETGTNSPQLIVKKFLVAFIHFGISFKQDNVREGR